MSTSITLRERAPDPPRVKTWQRRILSWGCAPAIAIGMVGGILGTARPEMAPWLAAAGTGLAILGAGPIAIYTWWLRRDNRARWSAAREEAEARGMRVKAKVTPDGDHEYVLEEPPEIEPLDWDEKREEDSPTDDEETPPSG